MINYQFSHYSEPIDTDKIWLALAISILLHSSIFYILPYFNQAALPSMTRIQVELNTNTAPTAEQQNPPPQPPTPEIPKPEEIVKPKPVPIVRNKPVKKAELAKPVLSSPEPAEPDDYVIPQNAEPTVAYQPPAAPSTPQVASQPKSSESSAPPSHVSVQSTQTEVATTEEAWDGYGKLLYDLVSKNKSYPAIAIRRNWEGEVKVQAKFNMGKLVEIIVIEESGREVLDQQAIDMIKKAIAQIPIKNSLAKKSFIVTVPVSFKLAQ